MVRFPELGSMLYVSHLPLKIQTLKMYLSCQNFQQWGRLNFEPFAAAPCALHDTVNTVFVTTNCTKDVYRSAARRQGGIVSGTCYVSQATRPNSHLRVILIDPTSTADEIPSALSTTKHSVDYIFLDPRDAPYASVKVFYRPRGGSFQILSYNLANALPELLMAQGVITGHNVGAGNGNGNREGSEVNDRKRAREDGSSGPSKRHSRSIVKKEDISAITQQIQSLQVSGAN